MSFIDSQLIMKFVKNKIINKHKTVIFLYLLLITAFIFSLPSYSACTSRQKNNICNACKTQALNSSECMVTNSCPTCSTCPSCPSTTCPTCVTSSQEVQAIGKRLKNSYNISVTISPFYSGISANDEVHNYTLFIDDVPATSSFLNTFHYTANYLNKGYEYKGAGSIEPLRIYFELPFVLGQTLHTFNCDAIVGKPGDGFLPLDLGSCRSIILDSEGKLLKIVSTVKGS